MRAVLLLLSSLSLFGGNPQEDVNVNSRYTVESVNISGMSDSRVNASLRRELDSVIGQKLDHGVLDHLALRLRHDLRVQRVSVKVHKGQAPDHVTVEFAVEGGHNRDFDLEVPKFVYHSRQGWTGIGEATTTVKNTAMTFGVLSDGDETVERFSGIRARVERELAGTGSRKVRMRFEFDSYHEQWNAASVAAGFAQDPADSGLYRTRHNFEPTVTMIIAPGLSWTAGATFEQLGMQYPVARTESSNALETSLHFHKGSEVVDVNRTAMDADYTLHAATRALGSDFVYVRHTGSVRYELLKGHNEVTLGFAAGGLNGRAPLYERFVLGNASTLRGWNKFDIAPLGGDRMVHGSIDYRYRVLTVFYDTGVVWSGPVDSGQRHGAGVGFRSENKEGFLIALAFPLRNGHVDPVLIAGFNF